MDSPVPPRRIVGREARDQGAQAGRDGRSTGAGGLGCPAASDELAVPAQDRGRGEPAGRAGGVWGAVGSARRSARGRSSSSVGVGCVVGAQRAGDAGPGSRFPCWSQIELAARSSPGASRTPGRSAAVPRTDHAGRPSPAKQQVRDVSRVSGTHTRWMRKSRISNTSHQRPAPQSGTSARHGPSWCSP